MEAKNRIENCWHEGDVVFFGQYNVAQGVKEALAWKVLEVTDRDMLLVTKDCVQWKPYHNCFGANVPWKNSTLREYLNEEFLHETFSAFESLFLERFPDESLVSILSKAEIETYMPEKAERVSSATPYVDCCIVDYCNWFYGTDRGYEDQKQALQGWRDGDSPAALWWVRGEGNGEYLYPTVLVGSDGGFVESDLHHHKSQHGVRPCIRLARQKTWSVAKESTGMPLKFRLIENGI